MFIRKS